MASVVGPYDGVVLQHRNHRGGGGPTDEMDW